MLFRSNQFLQNVPIPLPLLMDVSGYKSISLDPVDRLPIGHDDDGAPIYLADRTRWEWTVRESWLLPKFAKIVVYGSGLIKLPQDEADTLLCLSRKKV